MIAPTLAPALNSPMAKALALREPVGHRLDAGGEVAALADAEAEARGGEAGDAGGKAMRHMPGGPDDDRDRIAQPRPDHVDNAAEADIADRIGNLEPEDDRGKVGLGPAEFGDQSRLEHADHLAVDIVDRGGREQQADNHPAIAPCPARSGVERLGPCRSCGGFNHVQLSQSSARPLPIRLRSVPSAWLRRHHAAAHIAMSDKFGAETLPDRNLVHAGDRTGRNP